MTRLLDFVKPSERERRAREFAQRCGDAALNRVIAFAPDTSLGVAYREACFRERDARRIADLCSDAELDRILGLPDTPQRVAYKQACSIERQARRFARRCDDATLQRVIADEPGDRQGAMNRKACIAEAQRRGILEAHARELTSGSPSA